MIFSSFTEIVSLGLVFPFLAMLTDPKSLFENEFKLVGFDIFSSASFIYNFSYLIYWRA